MHNLSEQMNFCKYDFGGFIVAFLVDFATYNKNIHMVTYTNGLHEITKNNYV